MNVVYLAGGFPSEDNPTHGLFNLRAVKAISQHVNLTVVHYRMLKPGRKLHAVYQDEGYTRHVLCVPILPVMQNSLATFNNRVFRWCTQRFLRKELKAAHVVHASDGNLGVVVAPLKNRFSFNLLTQFIGGDLNQDLVHQQKQLIREKWTEKLDAVTFNSRSLQVVFQSMFGLHETQAVIYRGVDVSWFTPPENQVNDPISCYFLGGLPDYSWFTHGRNTKGGRTLMEAWSLLDKAGILENAVLKFAGPDSDIDEVQRWRKGLNEPDRVEVLGKVTPDKIVAFHRDHHIALIPSLEEGLPNAAMEAAATASAIIATTVGGIPEVIPTEEHGILLPPNEPERLAEAIHGLLTKPDKISQYGTKARAYMEEQFNSSSFGQHYVQMYQRINSF